MTKDLEVGVRLTADSKGLVGESRAGADALRNLGETAKTANTESAAASERFTANLKRQADTLGMTASQIRAYDAAQMDLNQSQRASVEASNKAITAYEGQQEALDGLKTRAAAAGVAIGTALVAGLKQSITLAGEAEQSHLRLAAVLRGTGHAAGLTKSDLDEMAEGMKEKLGIDDDALRDSMAVLLTFRNISRDSFGEALEVAADLSAVMKSDLQSAVLQLGKALESPDEGLTALKRSGVSFNDTQKDMIKDLVETGNQAEAITLILKTMKEQGLDGVAESMNQGITQASRDATMAWDDLLKTIGGTDTVKSGVDTVLGSWTGYLKDMRQVIESGDWLDRLAFFTIGLKTPDMIAKSNAPATRADDSQARAIAEEGLARQKAAQEAEIAAIAKKKADEEAAKAREEASKRAIAAARAREEANKRAAQQAVDSSNRIIAALKLETEQIGLNVIQKRMMSAAAEAAKAPTQELAMEIMASAQAWAVATQQQETMMAAEKERLNAIAEIEKAEKEAARAAEESARKSAAEWNQLWGGVEQTAKSSFIQFAAHGKSAIQSIGESIKLSIIDVLYQLTVRKWVINIGASLSGLVGAGAANAAGSGGFDLMSAANLGSSALSGIKGGFGLPGMIGNMGSPLPGAAGSFFSGMAGKTATQLAAESGATALWGASGASTGMAASMGSAFAAAAGPAMIALAVTQGLKALAGDKRLGGGFGRALNAVGDIPILGDMLPIVPLLNGLFGRGPMKQQGTLLSGQIGAEGFESGYLQTRFKAQGGLVRSDKIDFARVDAITGGTWTDNKKLQGFADELAKTAKEVFRLINDTTKQTSSSLRQIGQDLGLSTEGIDKFRYSINLLSEKGQMLTEEQIGQEIEKITDGLAHQLLPQVDELAKRGETALQTVSRLGTEFTTLVDATTLVLGKSAADARAFIQGSSFEDRTGFVDAADGLDALNQKVSDFAANFLTDAERLAPVQENLNAELNRLGLSTNLTRDQFRDLVQSFGQVNGITEETLQALLNIQGAFVKVRNATENLGDALVKTYLASREQQKEASAAQRASEKAGRREAQQNVIDIREQLKQRNIQADIDAAEKKAQRERDLLKQRFDDEQKLLDEAKRKSGVITSFIDSLGKSALSTSPLSFDDSRNILSGAIGKVRSGADFESIINQRLEAAASGAQNIDERLYSTYDDFARARGQAASQLNELAALGGNQLNIGHQQLSELETQSELLRKTYDVLSRRIDSGLEFDKNLATQDTMKGITSAQGTRKQELINAGKRRLFVLGNDLEPSIPEITSARISLMRTIRTPEAVFGGGKMDPGLEEILKIMSRAMQESAASAQKTEKILTNVTNGGEFMRTA